MNSRLVLSLELLFLFPLPEDWHWHNQIFFSSHGHFETVAGSVLVEK